MKDQFFAEHETEIVEKNISRDLLAYIFDNQLQKKLTDLFFERKSRVDGRGFEQVRAITTEVGLLPCVHGSALFKRGNTQALVTVTLGSGQDELRVETLLGSEGEPHRNFMLHYNFPPFSVGEARGLRAPGRREVGHGYLALSALKSMLPDREKFPYTIRVVADMLESDGSTSMATTCGTTMALMNAGVNIRCMVSGVAMGLFKSSAGEFQPVTDISGFEDAFGLMDFKVAGTDAGITAIQMDIKHKEGLPRQVFESALAQAQRGRMHILAEMRKCMTAPAATLSALVPQVIIFKVPTDKIGAIIGTGGKVIREIIEKTGASIDIEDDGLVKIFGTPGPKTDLAVHWVKTLGGAIERGARYLGKIRRHADFGVFVELVPGVDGLVHVSNIPRSKQRNLAQAYPLDTQSEVEVLDYEPDTGRIRLRFTADEAEMGSSGDSSAHNDGYSRRR